MTHYAAILSIAGMPIDLVVEARASKRAPYKRLAVVFSDQRPAQQYPVPTLWVRNGQGSWL